MLYIVLLGIFFATALVFVSRETVRRMAAFTAVIPLTVFVYMLVKIPAVQVQGFVQEIYHWVPAFGVEIDFRLDALSLLFALLISGIGVLVFWYTSGYLKGQGYLGRFYGYLGVFMSSMLGLVLSNNLVTLFIFWELTSISSFFLIGFKNEDAASRRSALHALLVTGAGGLALFAGSILLQHITGTFTISELISQKATIESHSLYYLLVVLFFLAAFTKSAQFPFHFWLPQAMKAPTPVSAYLHSATMVKAGVYLLLRFTPVLGGTPFWNYTITLVGGFAMTYAGLMILFKKDLKEILAFSTVSALGMMFFLIGMGSSTALMAVMVFVLTHGIYKAALFLVTGIIDRATGTRDVTVLSGLRKVLKPVFFAALATALICGGVPPTLGFISKDLVYDATLQHSWYFLAAGVAIVTNMLQFYGGFVSGVRPFCGSLPTAFSHVKMPPRSMWWPPLILAVLGVTFGILPWIADEGFLRQAALLVVPSADVPVLKLWHGFNTIILLSAVTLAGGLLLFWLVKPVSNQHRIVKLFFAITPEKLYERSLRMISDLAGFCTRKLQNGSLPKYVFVMILFLTSLLGYVLLQDGRLVVMSSGFNTLTVGEVTIISILLTSVMITLFSRSRLVSLVALSGVGLSVCMMFVFYSAPDLAMTQFLVDTLTVVLFVLILFRLPKFLQDSKDGFKWLNALLATAFGAAISLVCLKVLTLPVRNEITNYYADNAYTLAKGKNVVNVILVDFRGMDTLIETFVLVVAALGVYGLIKISLKEKY